MLYRIQDPVASTETKWDSSSKEVKVIHWHPSAQDANVSKAIEARTIPYSTTKKLGVQKLGGFVAEGTRGSYTVSAGQDHNNQPIVVVHETWYCSELKIVILETNDDPPDGTTRKELVNIVRGDPTSRNTVPRRITLFMAFKHLSRRRRIGLVGAFTLQWSGRLLVS